MKKTSPTIVVLKREAYGIGQSLVTIEGKPRRIEISGPRPPGERPSISDKPTVDGIICHNCQKPTCRHRSGAEFDGEVLCNNCGTVFFYA